MPLKREYPALAAFAAFFVSGFPQAPRSNTCGSLKKANVMPAKAGIQFINLDSGFRRNDGT
jgi:hypothetical protein